MSKQTFRPPEPAALSEHLSAYGVESPGFWQLRGPLVALVGGLLLSLLLPMPWGALLPWVALGGVVFYLHGRSRRLRRLQAEARRVQELTMLRRPAEALRSAWALLPQLTLVPPLHGRTIAMMAHCLDLAEAHDAAIVAYDYLLERMPEDHPGAVQLRVQRAISALFAERLTDADDALRRLRRHADHIAGSPLEAGYTLAQLMQDVRTAHYGEALSLSDDWTDVLRPLGVEAGYGHALVALCCHQTGRTEEAGRYWDAATTLLPAPVLLHRFPELEPLA